MARTRLSVCPRASLRTFLPREMVADAVREVESHIRDRVAQVEAAPNEREALERVLTELGPPLSGVMMGGYWIIPISLVIGLLVPVAIHRGARAFVRRWRERRAVTLHS
ncbi:MAG: HAAS signaling domain-containing protein [Vicinamibacterales bacterium]